MLALKYSLRERCRRALPLRLCLPLPLWLRFGGTRHQFLLLREQAGWDLEFALLNATRICEGRRKVVFFDRCEALDLVLPLDWGEMEPDWFLSSAFGL